MRKSFSSILDRRLIFRGLVSGCLVLFSGGVHAIFPENSTGTSSARVDFISTNDRDSRYRLEVRQAPMQLVLGRIEAETGVPFHYSVLPEGLVTATCAGPSIKTILECLLDGKADLIVRSSPGHAPSKNSILEAWVLGSRLDGAVAKDCSVRVENDEADIGSMAENSAQTKVEQLRTQELLRMAHSENPEERAGAIGAFLSEGGADDPEIKAVLDQALIDEDAGVRAQAVSVLSRREDSATRTAILQDALQDESPDVRVMAVDSITDDKILLQQAVSDSNESIRDLAAMKLAQLGDDSAAVK